MFENEISLKEFKMAAMVNMIDIGTDFSNTEFPCCPDASQKVLIQSVQWFETRCCLNNFKKTTIGLSLISEAERF